MESSRTVGGWTRYHAGLPRCPLRRWIPIAVLIAGCAPLEVFDDPNKQPPVVPSDRDTDAAGVDTAPEPVIPEDTAPEIGDSDGDGILDPDDNCVDVRNPGQQDFDGDGEGDLCDDDIDGDFIPNERDLFPNDNTLPGVASQDHVYAHGPSDLWRFDVPRRALQAVGSFRFDQRSGSITDIAIDQYGVLYAVSFSDVFVCNPDTAQCWWIGGLGGSYNGLTFVPDDAGIEDVLVGISTNGTWTAYTGVPNSVTPSSWGGYGSGRSSSGDAFHIRGTGTFAAVNTAGVSGIDIIEVGTHGAFVRTLTNLNYSGVFGIAGAANVIFAFTSAGAIEEIDMVTGEHHVVATGTSWWGAGVKTIVLP